jgi:hypothetical protein
MVEFVGFDEIWNKLHMLDRIQNICVANGQIQDLGGHGELSRIFPNLLLCHSKIIFYLIGTKSTLSAINCPTSPSL